MTRFSACPLAMVGMGVRLPGACDLDGYWEMLLAGTHAIAPVPASRLDRALYFQPGPVAPGKTYTELGGTVPDEDLDTSTLGLGEEEIRAADTAHLWFLHVALAALRHAGLDPDTLAGERLGVFVGHSRGTPIEGDIAYAASIASLTEQLGQAAAFAQLAADHQAQISADLEQRTRERYATAIGDGGRFPVVNAVAGLVARRLRTAGPYMAVDAACASSFAALDLAARAIHAGEIEAAIVGGCSYNQWSSLVVFSQAQAVSGTGSFPFDARGNGFISSDGYAAIVVEPLQRALEHKRRVLAIIRGIGGSCDGRGKSLWAPLKEGQVAAIRRAYAEDLAPESVQVIEAHATGTPVGDATEIAALAEVFGESSSARAPIPIASVKANIGHARETAGLAGLIKMVLAMQHGIVPPAVNFQTPSPEVEWPSVPFRVPTAPEPWPDRAGLPRRCAVDAFGIGGLNYHVVADGAQVENAVLSRSASVIGAEPIAIIGIGVVLPGALDFISFRNALRTPADFCEPPAERWESRANGSAANGVTPQLRANFLRGWEFDWRRHKVPPRQVQHSDPLRYMLVDAVAQALDRAGRIDTERTAVHVGSIFGGDFSAQLNIGLRIPEFERDLAATLSAYGLASGRSRTLADEVTQALRLRFPAEDEAGSYSNSTLASRISKHFDFMGPCCAIDAEEAGSLAALAAGMNALRAGDCEVAVCGGGQRTMHHRRFEMYARRGLLARDGAGGFHIAEGAVAVVLRRLSDAERDGQKVLAVLHDVSAAASPDAPWKALADAICRSRRGEAPASPVTIECFGAGTAQGELAEHRAIEAGYGASEVRLMSATPRFGMAQGASGLVSLAHLLATSAESPRARAAVNSVGLHGLAFHAVLETNPQAPERPDFFANIVPHALTRALPEPVKSGVPHFDATARRRARVAESQAIEPRTPSVAAAPLSALEQRLIEFVCEQTGYPPEVVSIDQDIEADLGIDSIKKARLLGELRDQYEIALPAGGGGLSFAQFITLRDVAEFLADKPLRKSAPPPSSTPALLAEPRGTSPNTAVTVVTLGGGPYEIGRQHGERFREQIRATLHRYKQQLEPEALEGDELKAAIDEHARYFDEPAIEELRGIAVGCGMAFEHLLTFNIAQEPRHSLAGCTQFAIRAAANDGDGLIHAANEDSPFALRMGNCLQRLVQVRRGGGRECCIFSPIMQVGGINGLNESGLVVSSTVLLDQPRDFDARGVAHGVLVLRMLERCADLEAAIELVSQWPRLGAWSLLISHAPSDRIAYLEYNERRVEVRRGVERMHTTNHSLLLGGEAPEHSRLRLDRAGAVLGDGPVSFNAVQALFRDRMDLARGRVVKHATMNTICRVDNQISFAFRGANGGELAVTPGPLAEPDADTFSRFSVPAFWSKAAVHSTAPDGRVMRRWILRSGLAGIAPAGIGTPATLPTLIVGEGPVAGAIGDLLTANGSTVNVSALMDAASLLDSPPPPHRLILLADERASALDQFATEVFALVQRWVATLRRAEALERMELVAVSQMGGTFGCDLARAIHPAGGALAGLLKSLRCEMPGSRIKVVDAPADEPPALIARCVSAELVTDDAIVEVGYVRGKRRALQLVPRGLDDAPPGRLQGALAEDAAWIVSGGGRGITALVARSLALRFGMHLHLLGRTPRGVAQREWLRLDANGRRALREEVVGTARARGEPPHEAWSRIENAIELEATLDGHSEADGRFTYHCVDVADGDAVQRVLDEIRRAGRPIRGIIHGAGIEAACEFSKKSAASVRATLASKVRGMENLLALTTGDPVEAIVGFGSVSGRFGAPGQTDYCMASDLLAKLLAAHRRATGIACCTIAWAAWGETGMATRPESRFALEAMGHQFLPVAEGAAHLVRELEAGLPESEIVIFDRPEVMDGDRIVCSAETEATLTRLAPSVRGHALLDGLIAAEADGTVIAEACFDPRHDVFLLDHQFESRPLLPAVIGLEALAEAALNGQHDGAPFAFENATIHAGMRFFSDVPLPAKVVVERCDARCSARLLADFIAKNGRLADPDREHMSAQIVTASPSAPAAPPPPPADAGWREMEYPPSLAECDARRVYHGPALRALLRLTGDGSTCWGDLAAPGVDCLRPARGKARWRLPAALLDGCLVACGVVARVRHNFYSLPAKFDRLVIAAMPGPNEPCRVWVRFRGEEERHLRFDFQLVDSHAQPILWAENYRTVKLAS